MTLCFFLMCSKCFHSHYCCTAVAIYFEIVLVFFFYCDGDHRDLHVLTHSFPTRRSSDLCRRRCRPMPGTRWRRHFMRWRNPTRRWPLSAGHCPADRVMRSEEHTSELQSQMRISYAVFCLKKKNSSPEHEVGSQGQTPH